MTETALMTRKQRLARWLRHQAWSIRWIEEETSRAIGQAIEDAIARIAYRLGAWLNHAADRLDPPHYEPMRPEDDIPF